MTKVLVDGTYQELTQEELEERYPTPSSSMPPPSDTRRIEALEAVSSISFSVLAEAGSIDDATATEHAEQFGAWESGVSYKVGDMRRHGEQLYRCVQAHTSQDDWTPDTAASLWSRVGDPAEEYPEWSQPLGAHDAYALGDRVTRDGKHWVSIVDSNVWEPGVYGWEEVGADDN